MGRRREEGRGGGVKAGSRGRGVGKTEASYPCPATKVEGQAGRYGNTPYLELVWEALAHVSERLLLV